MRHPLAPSYNGTPCFTSLLSFSGSPLAETRIPFRVVVLEFKEEEEKMVALVARTGREFQRYKNGRRLIVGCIPYRLKFTPCNNSVEMALEVLMISPQRGQGFIFPKGGWEIDENITEAVARETMEEAGVKGNLQTELGIYEVISKSRGITHEGHMFAMLVTEEHDYWPEKQTRLRNWVTVTEAREYCQRGWMKDALDKLVKRLEACSSSILTGGSRVPLPLLVSQQSTVSSQS